MLKNSIAFLKPYICSNMCREDRKKDMVSSSGTLFTLCFETGPIIRL